MDRFQNSASIFANEDAVKEDWIPDELPEREDELDELEFAFMPAVRGTTAHNVFIYGKAGQGKTAATEVILCELRDHFAEEGQEDYLTVLNVSCHDATSSYQVVGELLTIVEEDTDTRPKGRSLGHLNKRLFDALDEIGGHIVLVFDEIDNIGNDDKILYQIPRARSNDRLDETRVSIVGISNDLQYRDKLSPKVKDTLCDVEVRFKPYDANQLRTILRQRKEIAFEDGVLEADVVPLCAAYAAQDEGSARQAIKFLHRAGEIANREGTECVTTEHLEEARDSIEQEHVLGALTDLTIHDQITLMALASLESDGKTPVRTKRVYSEYKSIANHIGTDALTSRSVRKRLVNLDTYSLVITNEVSGGSRGGTRYESELNVEFEALLDAFIEVDRLSEIAQKISLNRSSIS